MSQTASDKPSRSCFEFLAPGTILATPFVIWIVFNDYPILSAEVLLCLLAFLVAGIGVSLVFRIKPTLSKPLVYPILLLLALDLHFAADGPVRLMQGLVADQSISITAFKFSLIAFFVLCALFCRVLLRYIDLILFAVFGTLLITTPFVGQRNALPDYDSRPASTGPTLDLPPVIHLILDEQIGLAGLPEAVPQSASAAQELEALYRGLGFRIFDNAFSSSSTSPVSIASLLNAAPVSQWRTALSGEDKAHYVMANRWFDLLAQRGYAIDVYQSSYLDFCRYGNAKIAACHVYPADSIAALRETTLDSPKRAAALMIAILARSLSYQALYVASFGKQRRDNTEVVGRQKGFTIGRKPNFGAVSSLGIFEQISASLLSQPRGKAIFAHLLIPHRSYLLDEDCKVAWPPSRWHLGFETSASTFNDARSRMDGYIAYSSQVRCINRRIEKLLTELERSGALDGAVVIVHGDHGSRIAINRSGNDDLSAVTDEDMIDNFSTFFAVRADGIEPGVDHRKWSIVDLFSKFLLNQAVEAPDGMVYWNTGERDRDQEKFGLPMPDGVPRSAD